VRVGVITAVAVIAYVVWSAVRGERLGGSSSLGFVYGIAALALIGFAFTYPLFRRFPRKKKLEGSRFSWEAKKRLRYHIWVALLAAPLAIMHSGVWPRQGLVSTSVPTLLFDVFVLVIASGVFGLALQQFLPRMLLHDLLNETLTSEIPVIERELIVQAEILIETAVGTRPGPVANATLRSEIAHRVQRGVGVGALRFLPRMREVAANRRQSPSATIGADTTDPSLEASTTSAGGMQLSGDASQGSRSDKPVDVWGEFDRVIGPYLRGERWWGGGRLLAPPAEAMIWFRDLRGQEPATAPLFEVLEQICDHRRQLDRQIRLHSWLSRWVEFHYMLSAALAVVLGIHIVTAPGYW
jgi:hypothetical protein